MTSTSGEKGSIALLCRYGKSTMVRIIMRTGQRLRDLRTQRKMATKADHAAIQRICNVKGTNYIPPLRVSGAMDKRIFRFQDLVFLCSKYLGHTSAPAAAFHVRKLQEGNLGFSMN